MMKLNIQTQMGASIGDAVEVDPSAFRVAKPHYKLADLLVQCNQDAPPPADMAGWDAMAPVPAVSDLIMQGPLESDKP